MHQGPQDIRVLSGVMDHDSAPYEIAPQNYREARNVINLKNDGADGSFKNVPSFIKLPNYDLKGGVNICVGSREDIKNQTSIFAVYNSLGYHGWFRYYANKAPYTNGVIEKLYQVSDPSAYSASFPNPLDFQPDKLITGIDLVDDQLFWTDYNSQPKMLNVAIANETGKRRKFNIFLNKVSFGNNTNYVLNIYRKNVGLVGTLNWFALTYNTYLDRTKQMCDLIAQSIALSSVISVVNNVNYATIEMHSTGEFHVELFDDGAQISSVVAQNFYPDFIAGIPSYPAMSEDLLVKVKYPPYRAPAGVFGTDGTTTDFLIQLEPYATGVPPVPNIPGSAILVYMGIINDSTGGYYDQGSNVTLGNAVITPNISGPTNFPAVPVNAYINYAATTVLQYTVNIPITVIEGSGREDLNPAVNFFKIYVGYIDGAGDFQGQLIEDFKGSVTPSQGQAPLSFNLSYSGSISLPVGAQLRVAVNHCNAAFPLPPWNISIPGGTIFGSVVSKSASATSVSSKAILFRARYQYREYQNSVYSLTSQVAITTEPRLDGWVDITFDDPRLADPSLSSIIRGVTLSLSEDGGDVWYDFKTLEPYEVLGPGQATYRYTGNETRIAVDAAQMLLQAHAVPIKSKSQAFIDERIWDGGLIEGYDSTPVKYSIQTIYTSMRSDIIIQQRGKCPVERSYKAWKRGWGGYIGIAYFDDADRVCKVELCENARVDIPYYNELIDDGVAPAPLQTLSPAHLVLSVFNEPPVWAKKWAPVRTKNLVGTNYLMWAANQVLNIAADGTEIPTATGGLLNQAPTYWGVDLSNIGYYNTKTLLGAQIEFTFTEGDRMRILIQKAGQGLLTDFYDVPVIRQDGNVVYINIIAGVDLDAGALIELYTPTKTAEEEELPYYEFGYTLEVKEAFFNGVLKRYHASNGIGTFAQDQSYGTSPLNVVTPAVVLLEDGGVYYRDRVIDTLVNPIPPDTVAIPSAVQYYISSSQYDDRYNVIVSGDGRVESANLLGQVNRPSAWRFSNQYYSGTKINGLSANEPANGKQMATDFGLIESMIPVNNDVLRLIFHNSKQESLYVNQGIIRQTQGGENIISQSEDVGGNARISQRTLGTVNPESCVLNDEGDIMGYDENEGAVWRYSGNGLLEISAYGLKTTWKSYSDQRVLLDRSKSKAVAVYDLYRDLYVVSLNSLDPKPEIKASANVKLTNVDDAIYYFSVEVKPLNQIFYAGLQPSGPGTTMQALMAAAFAAFPQYTVTNNPDGSVTVTAPNYGFNDQFLRVNIFDSVGTVYAYNFPFTGGQAAGSGTPFPGTTLAFSKSSVPQPGWTQYFDFVPEYYGKIRNQLIAFKDGELWLMYAQNTSFNNFFGVQYDSKVKWVLSKDYPKVKLPLALWYRGKGNWGSIMRIRPSDSYPLGMETQMTPAHFSLQEDGYYANVLKNKLDPRYPNTDQAWVNGEDLRGDIVEVELYNSENTPVRLDSVNLPYIFSENS